MAITNSMRLGVMLFAVACLALTAVPALGAPDVPAVAVIRVPNGGAYPQVQTDGRGRMHMIYFKGDPRHGDIFYVRSDDGGKTFTQPLRVNSQPDSALIIGTIRGPHLAIGKNERVHVAWMGSDQADPKSSGKAPMLYTRLADKGDVFEPQRNLIHSHPGLDGGGSVAADQAGNVYVAWHAPDAGDGEADRQVWVTRSSDEGKTFDPESAAVPMKTGVCGCCGLAIAAAEKGVVTIVFRSATEMVNRDVHVLWSKDYGKTFQIAVVDPWRIGMCVMSTASIAPDNGAFVSAWETKEQIRIGTLNAGTGQMGKLISVPGSAKALKHPSVAVDARGNFLVAWTEGTGWNKGGAVAWQVFDAGGSPIAAAAGRADGLPAWGVPAAFVDQSGGLKVAY